MSAITKGFSWLNILFARNKEGVSQDEAKKMFFRFRRQKVEREPGQEQPPEPSQPSSPGTPPEMARFMRDTALKLDRIEEDIDYLKRQVDKILTKI